MTEPGVLPPSYAVTEPIERDVNVDTVALICSETVRGRVLELNLCRSGPGYSAPTCSAAERWYSASICCMGQSAIASVRRYASANAYQATR